VAAESAEDGECMECNVDDCKLRVKRWYLAGMLMALLFSVRFRRRRQIPIVLPRLQGNSLHRLHHLACSLTVFSFQGESRAPKRSETEGGTVPAANAADAPVPKIAEKQGASHSVVR
jgi:hypothetical protein